MKQYLYDASGQRVAKGSISTWSCDVDSNGFVETTAYLDGVAGEQMTELNRSSDGSMQWTHTNVFANGKLIATYQNDNGGTAPLYGRLHFALNDWLGTKRMQRTHDGSFDNSWTSLPFGDGLSSSVPDATEHHFTGKERDPESGLDFFGARYYGSTMGRFMSPDPSNLGADIYVPQSWNRYAYVINRPTTWVDKNGYWPFYSHNNIIDEAFPGMSKSELSNLKTQSDIMDSKEGQQDPANSYMHSMSDGSGNVYWGGGNDLHAQGQAEDFVDSQIAQAQEYQANWVAQGHTGISPLALSAFGNALHTVEDGLSPAHRGYQPWANKPWWHYSTIGHFLTEAWRTKADQSSTRNAARALFTRTFGREMDWVFVKSPCYSTSAYDNHGNATGSSGCQP